MQGAEHHCATCCCAGSARRGTCSTPGRICWRGRRWRPPLQRRSPHGPTPSKGGPAGAPEALKASTAEALATWGCWSLRKQGWTPQAALWTLPALESTREEGSAQGHTGRSLPEWVATTGSSAVSYCRVIWLYRAGFCHDVILGHGHKSMRAHALCMCRGCRGQQGL